MRKRFKFKFLFCWSVTYFTSSEIPVVTYETLSVMRVNIPQLVAHATHYQMYYFRVSKKCEINHGHSSCYLQCIHKVSSRNITIYVLCKKEKTQVNSIMYYSHIICLFYTSHILSNFLMKICGYMRNNIVNVHDLFHIFWILKSATCRNRCGCNQLQSLAWPHFFLVPST